MNNIKTIHLFVFLVLLTGCAYHSPYIPGKATLPQDAKKVSSKYYTYPMNIMVGDFVSPFFSSVDVKNNIGTSIDCTNFGPSLKMTIVEELAHRQVFQKIIDLPTTPNEDVYLIMRGQVKELTITNNFGSSSTARGLLYTELCSSPKNEVLWKIDLKGYGTAPGRLRIDTALDYLRAALGTELVNIL